MKHTKKNNWNNQDQDSPKNSQIVLQVIDVYKSYYMPGQEVSVLRGANLVVEKGDFVAIVGKSGVGKSTLLHVAGTLDTPTSGKILYWGKNVFQLKEPQLAAFRNKHIGFVFQFHHLLPEFTALENTMIPGLVGGMHWKKARERAENLLSRVGLQDRLNHRPGELSGGEQQRVAIARALMMQPSILFADEPTGNLDEKTSDEIHELLRKLNEKYEITCVIVTHNFRLARKLDRTLLMRDGKIFALSETSPPLLPTDGQEKPDR